MGKTSSAVKDRYNKKAYDEIKLRVKSGEKKDIAGFAEEQSLSLNGYITQLIEKDMKAHRKSAEE